MTFIPRDAISDKDLPKLLYELREFVDATAFDQAYTKHLTAVRTARPLLREYYIKRRHPWWEPWTEFHPFTSGKLFDPTDVSSSLQLMAVDAHKLIRLSENMPESLKARFRRILLQEEGARSALFELNTAWNYVSKGFVIEWYEVKNESVPEFKVHAKGFIFDVECQVVSRDKWQSIKYKNAYKLLDLIAPAVSNQGLMGEINIEVEDKLSGSDRNLEELASEIMLNIHNGKFIKGLFNIRDVKMTVNLTQHDNKYVNLEEKKKQLEKNKRHDTLSAIYAPSSSLGFPTNAIIITLKSNKPSKLLKGVYDKIRGAIKFQLNKDNPSLITCLLPDVTDLSQLSSGSGLEAITAHALRDERSSHVAAISYTTEQGMVRTIGGWTAHIQTLTYRNEVCKYSAPKDFPYFNVTK